jgi:hypothetical protein
MSDGSETVVRVDVTVVDVVEFVASEKAVERAKGGNGGERDAQDLFMHEVNERTTWRFRTPGGQVVGSDE